MMATMSQLFDCYLVDHMAGKAGYKAAVTGVVTWNSGGS